MLCKRPHRAAIVVILCTLLALRGLALQAPHRVSGARSPSSVLCCRFSPLRSLGSIGTLESTLQRPSGSVQFRQGLFSDDAKSARISFKLQALPYAVTSSLPVKALATIVVLAGSLLAFVARLIRGKKPPSHTVYIKKRPNAIPQSAVESKRGDVTTSVATDDASMMRDSRRSRRSSRPDPDQTPDAYEGGSSATVDNDSSEESDTCTNAAGAEVDPSPVAVEARVTASGSSPEPPSLLSRLFGSKSPASQRSSDVRSCLLLHLSPRDLAARADEQTLRRVLLRRLLSALPPQSRAQVLQRGAPHVADLVGDDLSGEDVAEFGSSEDVAKIFADVANAVLVQAVDAAAASIETVDREQRLQHKDKAPASLSDHVEQRRAAVAHIFDAMEAAGAVFAEVAAGVAGVAPLLYNGRLKKSQLEAVYSAALREHMQTDMSEALSAASEGAAAASGGDAAARSSATTEQLLGRLQFLCDIKEPRRAALEQKVLMDVLLSGGAGSGDIGGLADLANFGRAGGDGDGDGGGDFGELEKLLSGLADKSPADQERLLRDMMAETGHAANGATEATDLAGSAGLSPEEAARATQEALAGLQQALHAKQVTAQDVGDFERMTGMDVAQFSQLLRAAARDRGVQRELQQSLGGAGGLDFAQLQALFDELAQIKARR